MTQLEDEAGTRRADSAFTDAEVRLLHERSPGWERVWGRLWEVLNERLHEMLIGGTPNDPDSWRQSARFLRDPNLAMDFIADYLFGLNRKAEAGTLLGGYDGDAPVEVYLSAPSLIRLRAIDFVNKHGPGGWETLDGDVPPPAAPEIAPGLSGLGAEDRSITIHWSGKGRVNAVVGMAMLQCWPRVASEQPGRPLLEAAVLEEIRPPAGTESVSAVETAHRDSRQRLLSKIEAINKHLDEKRRMAPKTRARSEQQRFGLEADLLLHPLDADALQALLGLERNAIYQRSSRYRRHWEELFIDFHQALEDRRSR